MVVELNNDPTVNSTQLIGKLDDTYTGHSILGKQYKLFKEEANRILSAAKVKTNSSEFAALSEKEKSTLEAEFEAGMMLLLFTQELMGKTNKHFLLLAQVCFTFARDGEHFERIQSIFEQSLVDTAYAAHWQDPPKQMKLLFSSLKQKISKDKNLRSALSKAKIVLPGSF